MNVVAHIVENELEARIANVMGDVAHVPCNQVVHRHNMMSLSDEAIHKMRPDEACSACDENSQDVALLRREFILPSLPSVL